MKFFLAVLSFLFFSPFLAQAESVDLSIVQSSISFSKETLITGDTVRIYAVVKNVGTDDVSGYVNFAQGSLPIGDSQVISLRAGGLPEEVYVDFVVPSGTFNIRAEIRGTDPPDSNNSNDSTITQLITPIQDDDRDGIENSDDNCPSTENANQLDTDLDGFGDVCDDDDDNDGVTDEVEREIGTNSLNVDTDGDGLADNVDPHPTTPESQIKVETPVETPKESNSTTPSLFSDNENTAVVSENETNNVSTTSETITEDVNNLSENTFAVSPNAVFTYQKLNWNTYRFQAELPTGDGYHVTWDFGDTATSSKVEVTHTYQKTGDYKVKILVEGADEKTSEDSVTIHVSFFSLGNRLIQLAIGSLILILLILMILFFKAGRGKNNFSKKTFKKNDSGALKVSVRQDNSEFE